VEWSAAFAFIELRAVGEAPLLREGRACRSSSQGEVAQAWRKLTGLPVGPLQFEGSQLVRYCIVGAGFSGAVIGRALAQAGHKVLVIDERAHVAGNCFSKRDSETGIMVHVFGSHIFHASDERVWAYVQKFGEMVPYQHRVQAVAAGAVYSLPINLLTINQFFGRVMSPGEARDFIASKSSPIENPANFEEQALCMIGPELYHTFFRGYTRKQWGLDPKQLPAPVLKRLPLRFNYDDSYFAHRYQAMPRHGYTELVAAILDAPNLELRLSTRFEDLDEPFAHVVYSGPIDRFFHYEFGHLGYRTLDFEVFRAKGDYQGTAVLNYCDESVPFTRVIEHKYFASWERDQFEGTICYREFSRQCEPKDIPYSPIRQTDENAMLSKYVERARATSGVSFVGRLGSYRYLDMDVTIGEALAAADVMLAQIREGAKFPAFFVTP
jgi:UDP-galactopyranose mutase